MNRNDVIDHLTNFLFQLVHEEYCDSDVYHEDSPLDRYITKNLPLNPDKSKKETADKVLRLQEIEEGNKLIATFLWGEPQKAGDDLSDSFMQWTPPDDNRGVFWSISCWYDEVGTHIESELFFHASWDWLMPVVEKVEVIINEEALDGRAYWLHDAISTIKIDVVWEYIKNFIQWYNKKDNVKSKNFSKKGE